jgi:hypothetical protein
MANILPVAHSLTGCDTTSSFFDIGKKTVYKILKQNTTKYQTLTNLASSDVDACVEAGRLLVADLYDPKGSAKSVHRDLNKLRVKLALSKDSSLVKLPPSEAAFRQHILRVAFQVYVWTHANEAKPPPRSPLEYGWRNENKYLMPKYFEGPMTSDFLQDPVCVCKGKSICSKNCVCVEQNLSCTSICDCQGNEECRNQLSHQLSVAENLGNDENCPSDI